MTRGCDIREDRSSPVGQVVSSWCRLLGLDAPKQPRGEISLAASANLEVTIHRFAKGDDVPGETGEARRSERLLALAAEAEPHLAGSESATWMNRLESDHAGLQAAFSWFLRHGKGA